MRVLLTKHNRRKLVELVESGGIVLCEEYFLNGFTKGKCGHWVNTSTAYGGTDEEYSFFVKEESTLDVYCFAPIKPMLK